MWVATVANIDWPSRPGLTTDEQRREAIALLDKAAALRMNAVVLQVRTAADALYASELEPWSAVLSGRQGQAPEPFYDPLGFWVKEAHDRGLQLHAWFNPFRAKPSGARYELAEGHVGRSHPEWVKPYGDQLWMDPGAAPARERTMKVVGDVVRRYDVDGIHIDDYFYPYPVNEEGKPVEFPDGPSWRAYQEGGGTLSRPDWRRRNINLLVEGMNRTVHEIKPRVQFGVSPFGIPRPGRPPGVVGFDQYESLYADTELWLRNGWCDYWSPQLYWKIDAPGQPFRPLLDHWRSENRQGRHLWPGLSISRVGEGERGYAPEEITEQIAIIRETDGADGHVLFSMKALMRNNRGLADRLADGPYRTAALVPTTPWLDREPPPAPHVAFEATGDALGLVLRPGAGERPFLWGVWARYDQEWRFAVYPANQDRVRLEVADGKPREVAVAAVDRLGNESARWQGVP